MDAAEFTAGEQPAPEQVLLARRAAGLTLADAAASVYLGAGARWAEYENGRRTMDAARWELFLLKHGLHPNMRVRTSQGLR